MTVKHEIVTFESVASAQRAGVCAAGTCGVAIRDGALACDEHWALVPPEARELVAVFTARYRSQETTLLRVRAVQVHVMHFAIDAEDAG